MAPIGGQEFGENVLLHLTANVRRDGSSSGASNAGPAQAVDASAASGTSSSLYLGLGLGVGGAILIAVVTVVVQIARKRSQHKRMVEALEVEEAVQAARTQEIAQVPRPASVARCSTLVPLHARAGWSALASDETVNEAGSGAQANKRKRSSVSLPKRFKQSTIPLKRLKRLTAIMESPKSKTTISPIVPFPDSMQCQPTAEKEKISEGNPKAYTLRRVNSKDDVFVCPESPKLEVLPSYAIRSPGRYGAGIANNDNPKASRSRSVGALVFSIPGNAVLNQTSHLSRPSMHARSVSLGAPQSLPPSGPVPPLPVIAPHSTELQASVRQGVCVSRLSSSSQESTGSSVLITSPVLRMHEQDKAVSSPRVEQVIAEEDGASLKTVSQKQWQRPLVSRRQNPFPDQFEHDRSKSQVSIRSNIARYSAESVGSHRVSSISTASSDSNMKRLSIPQLGTADQVSISRVSSSNSLSSYSGVQKITTPRRSTRSSVSANGSPAERRKTSVLRDISGNSMTPSRKASNATEDSGRSSNGNPFQWDQPLPKHSALKGSPNARKGHKRQNCVRISTLTPQILGPPTSRPTSPNIMHGIEEESGDGDEAGEPNKLRFASDQRTSRPPSAASFAPNLRMQILRASLTPSSPTLSAWAAFQEHGLPSQPSDSQLSVSQLSASPATRAGSRQSSDRSSAFSIPSFPSPVKTTLGHVQLSQPVPEFYLSRPSTDIEEGQSASPFALHLAPEPELPSSPPLPVSKTEPYDPAHPALPYMSIAAPRRSEYDPASPEWNETDPQRSSPFLPFAASSFQIMRASEEISPRSRPTSYGGELPDTPPCSPKTMPEGFQLFFDKQDSGSKPARASERLTSANASAVMARMPSRAVDFPGAPILLPPEQPEDYSQTTPPRPPIPGRQRAVSTMDQFLPVRPAPPPPVSPSIDTCVPSPLHVGGKTSPQGPRKQPAQSVLKNAMALRRMNSEVNDFPHRESRRYVHLGREASPLLPWIGSPDPSESCIDMNELFDFGFASSGAEIEEEHKSALDEIDMSEVERKLDGAIAGFDAISSDDNASPQQRHSSVWEDGERYWEQVKAARAEIERSSPLPSPADKHTARKEPGALTERPRSIQMTPKSLYDSEGFLRT